MRTALNRQISCRCVQEKSESSRLIRGQGWRREFLPMGSNNSGCLAGRGTPSHHPTKSPDLYDYPSVTGRRWGPDARTPGPAALSLASKQ